MKKSKSALKVRSKKYNEQYTYGVTVYGSQLIDFWYETPRETIQTTCKASEFLSGTFHNKVSQYLGNDVLEEILSFIKRKWFDH